MTKLFNPEIESVTKSELYVTVCLKGGDELGFLGFKSPGRLTVFAFELLRIAVESKILDAAYIKDQLSKFNRRIRCSN